MKIATWNLMRPNKRTTARNQLFIETINSCNADIIILTETNSIVNPGTAYFSRSTKELPSNFEGFIYSKGENRTTIFSKFPFSKDFKIYDEYTSVCSEIATPHGPIIFYATIIGVTGGKDKRFIKDFESQKIDITNLASNSNLCVIGDFNISFSGYAYPSDNIIKKAKIFFDETGLNICTKDNKNSPDHIAISKSILSNPKIDLLPPLLFDKKTTDHSLISINVTY